MPGRDGLLRSDQELVERPVAVYGRGDIARGHTLRPCLDQPHHVTCSLKLRDDLAIVPLAGDGIVERVAALGQHPLDEMVELGQGLGRCVRHLFLERLPLGLPLVPVESWFEHRLPASPREPPFKPAIDHR